MRQRFIAIILPSTASLTLALTSITPDARACSYTDPFVTATSSPRLNTTTLPANVIFAAQSEEPKFELDGGALELESTTPLPGFNRAWRASTPLEPGDVISPVGCEDARCELTIIQADEQAPDAAEISDPAVFIDDDDRISVDCSVDSFTFSLRAFDAQTPSEQLLGLAYFGATEEEASSTLVPGEVFELPVKADSGEPTTEIKLLGSRPDTFDLTQPFCFAIEVMDLAGNRSERSAPLCIDPTDLDAPYVTTPGRGGCATTSGTSPAGAPVLLFLGIALVVCGRRQRTSA